MSKAQTKTLNGPESVVAAIKEVTGVELEADTSLQWYPNYKQQLAAKGWDLTLENGRVNVQDKHVAMIATKDGTLGGVVMEGKEVITNKTDGSVAAHTIAQRLRLKKTEAPAEDSEQAE